MIFSSRFSRRFISIASFGTALLTFVSCGGSGTGGDGDPWIPTFIAGYTISIDTTGGTQTGGNPGIVVVTCSSNDSGVVSAPKLANTVYLVNNLITYIPIDNNTASISFGYKVSPTAPWTETFIFNATFEITEHATYNQSLRIGRVLKWSRTSWTDHSSTLGNGGDCPLGSASIIPTNSNSSSEQ